MGVNLARLTPKRLILLGYIIFNVLETIKE